MRPASTALTNYLNSAANLDVVQVDLYTFALTSGEVLRWSGGDTALTIPAAGFPAGSFNHGADHTFTLGPRFGRSKVTTKIGVQPAELDIELIAGGNDLVGTFPIADAVRMGLFDGATVELDRLFAPPQAGNTVAPLDTSLGTLLWFYGRVAETDIGRSKIAVKVKSLMNLLAIQQMPRRLYGASCTHIFGDAMCGYDRALGKNALGVATGIGQATVTADIGSDQKTMNCTAAVPNYVQGTVKGLAGANAGYTRTIVSTGNGSQIEVIKAWLFPITPGDTFTILPGCDHTVARCNNDLQNLLRFGGFPYIPPPEAAI